MIARLAGASAEDNALARTPVLGGSSWCNFVFSLADHAENGPPIHALDNFIYGRRQYQRCFFPNLMVPGIIAV